MGTGGALKRTLEKDSKSDTEPKELLPRRCSVKDAFQVSDLRQVGETDKHKEEPGKEERGKKIISSFCRDVSFRKNCLLRSINFIDNDFPSQRAGPSQDKRKRETTQKRSKDRRTGRYGAGESALGRRARKQKKRIEHCPQTIRSFIMEIQCMKRGSNTIDGG